MTNRGLETNARHWRRKDDPTFCLVRLNCGVAPRGHTGIYLSHIYDTYDRIRIEDLCDMEKINYDDWEEELSNVPILIRANNYSSPLICPSIFVLDHPKNISIGPKYFMDFATSLIHNKIQLLDEGSHSALVQGLKKHEFLVAPDRIIFINIELQNEETKSEFDVIINLTDNSFPSVGILERSKEPWQRLGDPLERASEIYGALATHLHYKVPSEPTYPMIANEETGNRVIIVHLLPRPPKGRSLNVPAVNAKFTALREYVLKIVVEQYGGYDGDVSDQPVKKRKIS